MVSTRFFSLKRRLLAAALGVFLLFAIWQGIAFRSYLQSLSRPVEAIPEADAIVSLAGASGRLDRGLDLLLEGKADILLLSGTGKGATLKDIFPGRDLAVFSEKVILLENRSTSTYENAIEAWAVLSAVGSRDPARGEVHDIVLLTSNYHMLRAEFVFRKVFPSDVRIHVYPVGAENVSAGRWWRDGHARKVVLMEYMKYLWYRLRY